MGRVTALAIVSVLFVLSAACADVGRKFDFDGDGAEDADDCAPEDATTFPGAPDTVDNGLDNNCDGVPGIDTDGDGFASAGSGGADCNDGNPDLNPGATEVPNNEVDEDCDGEVLFCDADGDGVLSSHALCGGSDCDDTNAACFLAAHCDDADGDGQWACLGDCDDLDPVRFLGNPETCDGLDNDCSAALPADEQDVDGDGEAACAGDCDDEDASMGSAAAELCSGLDEDCSGAPEPDEIDADADGFLACAECDDGDPATYPGAVETPYDGVDQDCDGADLIDVDGDGFAGNLLSGDPLLDCNDGDALIYPGSPDPPFDGVNTNCDMVDGVDTDGDGWPWLDVPGEEWQTLLLDCDDTDPALNLDDADGDGSSTCAGDCDDLDAALNPLDGDGDGVSTCDGTPDCDDTNAAMSPLANEICDLFDNDCDGVQALDEVDGDGDGDPTCSDCDDADPTHDTLDRDGDGWDRCPVNAVGQPIDCDDLDPGRFPGQVDGYGDGVDSNCDGVDGVDWDGDGDPVPLDCDDLVATLNLDDLDLDGFSTCTGDCDDLDPALDRLDDDLDGQDPCEGDCDDDDQTTWSGAPELADGLDNDCDGTADEGTLAFDDDGDGSCEGVDIDGDGAAECSDGSTPDDCDDVDPVSNTTDADGDGVTSCDGDCDDFEPLTWPGAPEQCDVADNDCDGLSDEGIGDDTDGDGYLPCAGDCDNTDPTVYPTAPELCDGIDNVCAGGVLPVEADDDGDGWRICGGDCDDTSVISSPAAIEVANGLDDDCDGTVDDDAVFCTIDVPAWQPTIQAGLAAAAAGDVICVAPGTYAENIDFLGVDSHLVGVAGPALTILDGGANGAVVRLDNGEGPAAILEGFTVTNGSYGGVSVYSASPTLRRLVVTNNTGAAGVNLGYSSASLTDSTITNNGGSLAGGVRAWGGAGFAVTLDGLFVAGNQSAGAGGGITMSAGTVSNTTIEGNSAGGDGGGISIGSGVLQNVRVVDNAASLCCNSGGSVAITGAVTATGLAVIGQTTNGAAGGILVKNGSLDLSNSVILDNRNGALSLQGTGTASLTNVVMAEHTAAAYGSANVSCVSCVFWNNGTGGVPPPIGTNGNVLLDPGFLDMSASDPAAWDLHLSSSSPLIDAGDPSVLDPDGSPSDIGVYGGPGADQWDLDGDGYPSWWQPGPYDLGTYPALGWDCDDLDPQVNPATGC